MRKNKYSANYGKNDNNAISTLINSSPNPKYEQSIIHRLSVFHIPVNDITYHDIVVLSYNLIKTNRRHASNDQEHIIDAIVTNVTKQYHNMYTHHTAYHYYQALVVLTEFRLIVISEAPGLQYSAGGISLARITKVDYHKNSLVVYSPEIHSDMGITRVNNSLHLITNNNNKFYAKMNHDIIIMILTYYPTNNILTFSAKKRRMFWIFLVLSALVSAGCITLIGNIVGFVIMLAVWIAYGIFAVHIISDNYATGHSESGFAQLCFNMVNHIHKNEQ